MDAICSRAIGRSVHHGAIDEATLLGRCVRVKAALMIEDGETNDVR